MMAKLFVSAGAPLQNSAGERFLPLQPKPLNTWSSAIVLPWPMSGLTRVNFPRPGVPAGFLAAGASAATAKLLGTTATKATITSLTPAFPRADRLGIRHILLLQLL